MELDLALEEEGGGAVVERSVEVDEGATVKDVLEAAGIAPETVIVERDGAVVPLPEEVGDAGELRVLRVVSGG